MCRCSDIKRFTSNYKVTKNIIAFGASDNKKPERTTIKIKAESKTVAHKTTENSRERKRNCQLELLDKGV